jgi:arginine:agmatine antiporter
VAMWRLNWSIAISSGRRHLLVAIGVVACLYCIGVVLGQSAVLNMKALIVLLFSTPLFALVGAERRWPETVRVASSVPRSGDQA